MPGRSKLPRKVRVRLEHQRRFMRKLDKRYRWLAAGLFCFALFPILSYFPVFTEKMYSRGVYVAVRYFYDYTVGLTHWTLSYGLMGLVGVYILWKLWRFIRFNLTNKRVSLKNRFKYALLSIGAFLGKVSVVFFLGWGFNYWRMPVEEVAGIYPHPLDETEMYIEANLARKKALEARRSIRNLDDNTAFTADQLPPRKLLADEMSRNLNKVMDYLGYPTYPNLTCKLVERPELMHQMGYYTGVYVSFFGETQVNAKMGPVYIPFMMAHEMVHAHGFFDEATANFLAWLACEQSDDPRIVYSGRLAHLLYVMNEFSFTKLDFPKALFTDLRRNGAFASEAHYNRMIIMIPAWRNKHPVRLDGRKNLLLEDN